MNILIFNIFLSFIIFCFILLLPKSNIYSFLIYDNINKDHSINKKTVPLISSLTLFPPIFFYYEYDFLLISISLFLYLIGYLDDRIHLKIKYRFFFSVILILFLLIKFNDYRIEYLYFFDYRINFTPLSSITISLFMILGFFHVINMSDGRNCLVIIYFINIFIFLLFKNDNYYFNYYLITLISLFLIFIQNYFNKSFFGNSGVLFVSIFIAMVLIYEFNKGNLSIENIFILLYLPFFDALRVTITRIYKKKSPFLSEKNHLHHLPRNWNLALIILIMLFILNNIIQLFSNFSFLIISSYSIISFLAIFNIFKRI